MLVLKEEKEHRIVMHGFATFACKNLVMFKEARKSNKILFHGTKTELLEKPETFWREIVESEYSFSTGKSYRDYITKAFLINGALESGHSAISIIKEPYVLIVKEILN